MIYLWEKISFKQRDKFHFSTLFWAPKSSERKSQFHSFSAILLICAQRQTPSNRQAKDTGAWKRTRTIVTCSLVWASCNTTLLLRQNLVLLPLLRSSEVPLNLHSGTGTNFDNDVAFGNISWKWLLVFHVSELGQETEDLTFDYFGPSQTDKWWDTVSGFCWCHFQCTQSSWYLGQWFWAFPWQNDSVPELCWAFVQREALGAFQQKPQDRFGELRVSCHLPVSLVLGKPRKTITCGQDPALPNNTVGQFILLVQAPSISNYC